MGRLLFVVSDVVVIKGRGIALFAGIRPIGEEVFHAGETILLRKPDGSSVTTKIGSLAFVCPNPRNEIQVMLTTLRKDDVPVGTEVWSIDAG
jgi:hypothetical protein